MIMKRYFIVLFSLLLAMNTTAQEKQLTAQDLIPGGKNAYRFVPQSLRQLSFVGDNYIYRQGDIEPFPVARRYNRLYNR